MAALSGDAELYALLHRGTPGDSDFYRRACAGARDVLELGCGFGRLLAPLLEAGHRVTGIDIDEGMLALARERLTALPEPLPARARLAHADMRSLELDGRFERILIPYNGLYCLASEDEQAACLAGAARHLAPGGRIVFDAYAIDAFHAEADEQALDEDDEPLVSVAWRNTVWDVFEHCDWDRSGQRLAVRYRCVARDGSAAIEQHIDHRYLLTDQLEALCARAGLRLLRASGGFNDEPLTPDSEHFACTAAR